MTTLYLASGSPRRRQLLHELGLDFAVVEQSADETLMPGEEAEDYVRRLALAKAASGLQTVVSQGLPVRPVMGSDTAVCCDGDILGKPANREQGLAMLARLSGRSHEVFSGVALDDGQRSFALVSCTRVFFRTISTVEAQAYWDTGEPADKAGGYGIQGIAARFVSRIEGSYSGVVGLPLVETQQLLGQFGIECSL